MAAAAPEPGELADPLLERALAVLLQLLRLRVVQAWKCVQLAVVTLHNASARSAALESHCAQRGLCGSLLSIANAGGCFCGSRCCACRQGLGSRQLGSSATAAPGAARLLDAELIHRSSVLLLLAGAGLWPRTVRDAAAGHLQALLETHRNLRHLQEGAAAQLHQQVRLLEQCCFAASCRAVLAALCLLSCNSCCLASRPTADLHLSAWLTLQLGDQPILDDPAALDRQAAAAGGKLQARRRHGVHGHDAASGVAAATGTENWGWASEGCQAALDLATCLKRALNKAGHGTAHKKCPSGSSSLTPSPCLPTRSYVPFLGCMVQLLQSGEPLLALRGARGVARACFKAPAGCPCSERELLAGVKAQVVKLGGIGALVQLLKATNRRWAGGLRQRLGC